jgi:hypothetical protein
MPVFAAAEYRDRLTEVKTRVEEAGIELLAVDPVAMDDLSSFGAPLYDLPQALIFALDEEELHSVGRQMDAGCGPSRTVFLSDPPAKLTALVPAVVDGMAAALDAARTGITCEEVEAAWRRSISSRGYEKPSRIGYSIGIGYAGLDWNERSASLKPGDRTIIQENMVFHLMLGMWMGDWGFVLSETFRVTEDGAPETFTRLPRQLFVQ